MNTKRGVRLTRRSYRRKLIMFGVSIFMSLALVATGFAAWVLSKDAQQEASGEVTIGAVTEASIEISDITFIGTPDATKAQFIFEPLESDTTGRVRYDGESAPEKLGVAFTWSISNYQIVGDLFVDFKVPATVYTAIENGWLELPEAFALQNGTETIDGKTYKVLRYTIQTAAGSITANGSSNDGILSYTVTKDANVVTDVTFTMNVAFAWGDEFDGLNPGIYYDTPSETPTYGANIEFDTMKTTLNTFKATLHGIDVDEYLASNETAQKELCSENPIPNYIIIINANVA